MRGGESRCSIGEGLGEASWDSAFWGDMMPVAESHLKAPGPQPILWSGRRQTSPHGVQTCVVRS